MRAHLHLAALGRAGRRPVVFCLRREPLYHKLQYSKVPKFDAAAAVFGVIVGAFAAYLGLSSLGSAGADLTDLTVLCWYVGLGYAGARSLWACWRDGGVAAPALAPALFLFEVGSAVVAELGVLKAGCRGARG